MARLTGRQRRFIIEYLSCDNATEAAKRAGYNARDDNGFASIGSENLTKPKIKAVIDAYWQAESMPASEAIARVSRIARTDMSLFLTETGAVDWGAVHEYGELVKRVSHRKGQVSQIELHDSLVALDKICRAHGIFVDKKEISGPEGGPIEIGIKEVVVEIPDETIVDGGGRETEAGTPQGAS